MTPEAFEFNVTMPNEVMRARSELGHLSGCRSANTIRACGHVAARQGQIHDRKTRLRDCVIVLANWGGPYTSFC
jgi:hypothetical protein